MVNADDRIDCIPSVRGHDNVTDIWTHDILIDKHRMHIK